MYHGVKCRVVILVLQGWLELLDTILYFSRSAVAARCECGLCLSVLAAVSPFYAICNVLVFVRLRLLGVGAYWTPISSVFVAFGESGVRRPWSCCIARL